MESNSGAVAELFLNPRHVGEATRPQLSSGGRDRLRCGAILRITVRIDDSQRITEAKFKAAGCSVLVAAASSLIERCDRENHWRSQLRWRRALTSWREKTWGLAGATK